MKKHEIKKAVRSAVEKALPEAIKSHARGKAYDAVHQAMQDEREETGEHEAVAGPGAPVTPSTASSPAANPKPMSINGIAVKYVGPSRK